MCGLVGRFSASSMSDSRLERGLVSMAGMARRRLLEREEEFALSTAILGGTDWERFSVSQYEEPEAAEEEAAAAAAAAASSAWKRPSAGSS